MKIKFKFNKGHIIVGFFAYQKSLKMSGAYTNNFVIYFFPCFALQLSWNCYLDYDTKKLYENSLQMYYCYDIFGKCISNISGFYTDIEAKNFFENKYKTKALTVSKVFINYRLK